MPGAYDQKKLMQLFREGPESRRDGTRRCADDGGCDDGANCEFCLTQEMLLVRKLEPGWSSA